MTRNVPEDQSEGKRVASSVNWSNDAPSVAKIHSAAGFQSQYGVAALHHSKEREVHRRGRVGSWPANDDERKSKMECRGTWSAVCMRIHIYISSYMSPTIWSSWFDVFCLTSFLGNDLGDASVQVEWQKDHQDHGSAFERSRETIMATMDVRQIPRMLFTMKKVTTPADRWSSRNLFGNWGVLVWDFKLRGISPGFVSNCPPSWIFALPPRLRGGEIPTMRSDEKRNSSSDWTHIGILPYIDCESTLLKTNTFNTPFDPATSKNSIDPLCSVCHGRFTRWNPPCLHSVIPTIISPLKSNPVPPQQWWLQHFKWH